MTAGSYVVADIHGGEPKKNVAIFLRRTSEGWQIVGIDRGW